MLSLRNVSKTIIKMQIWVPRLLPDGFQTDRPTISDLCVRCIYLPRRGCLVKDKRQKTKDRRPDKLPLCADCSEKSTHTPPPQPRRPETGVDDIIGQRCPLPSISTRPFFALFQLQHRIPDRSHPDRSHPDRSPSQTVPRRSQTAPRIRPLPTAPRPKS